eukprot:6201697-Pleurochrysis_carterae.AAC.1
MNALVKLDWDRDTSTSAGGGIIKRQGGLTRCISLLTTNVPLQPKYLHRAARPNSTWHKDGPMGSAAAKPIQTFFTKRRCVVAM